MKAADSSPSPPPRPRHAALILAAGRGERAGFRQPGPPKQYRPVAGIPLLCHALRPFLAHEDIHRVLVVVRAGERPLYEAALRQAGLAAEPKLLAPACGGDSRQESVRAGLESLAGRPPQKVLVHDGARPAVRREDISACLEALQNAAAVAPALPLADALKRCDGEEILHHAPRQEYRLAQTPQGFDYAALLQAHRDLAGACLPDDAAVMERAGVPVRAFAGRQGNFKVTRAGDFARAEAALDACGPLARVGWGFDVHRLVEGRPLRLCGVEIPHGQGLAGHSDADVGLHALTDAILGAVAAGDIGEHFPPGDARWRGADSGLFLARAAEMAREAGFCVAHVDITLVCESPKLAPHRLAMRQAVAGLLGLEAGRVSIKATTTEGLGFLGRREAIAAQAVAGLARRSGE